MPDPTLTLRRCEVCATIEPAARVFCAQCGSDRLVPEAIPGDGAIVSWTIVRRPAAAFRDLGAIPIAVARLDAGVTVTGRFAGDPVALAVGRRVTLHALDGDVPVFG